MREVLIQLWKDKFARIALIVLGVIYLALFFADFLAPYTKDFSDRSMAYVPPSKIFTIDENGKFSNNIKDKNIASAEKLMKKIVDEKLYNTGWYEYYPNDNSTLFYAMGDWALGMTNAKNAKKDIILLFYL